MRQHPLTCAFESLPGSLDVTYERMLCEIGKESREEAQRILTLLCFSSRPLSVAEVIDALDVDVYDLQRYDCDRKLENSEDLLRICPGLIDIRARQRKDDEDHNNGDSHLDSIRNCAYCTLSPCKNTYCQIGSDMGAQISLHYRIPQVI